MRKKQFVETLKQFTLVITFEMLENMDKFSIYTVYKQNMYNYVQFLHIFDFETDHAKRLFSKTFYFQPQEFESEINLILNSNKIIRKRLNFCR